jgi:hypothetical protein
VRDRPSHRQQPSGGKLAPTVQIDRPGDAAHGDPLFTTILIISLFSQSNHEWKDLTTVAQLYHATDVGRAFQLDVRLESPT